MRDNYNEKLAQIFLKMTDEQKADILKPQTALSYEEIQERLQQTFNTAVPASKKAVIDGWVARDRNGDLTLYQHYPQRKLGFWRDRWDGFDLPNESLPSVTWESEPRRVRIEITLIDEKGE